MEAKYIFVLLFFMIVVGLPVLAGVYGDVHKRRLKLKERELELTSQLTAEKTAQYAAQTERLEQRVRVLERIVTDRGMGVAEQIEQLRDEPLKRVQ
jgi:predicted Holliday junction resolvase-like endonuclease